MGGKCKKKIPEFVAPCLWSYNIDQIDLEKDKEIIITMVLNYGDVKRIRWLYSVYSEDDIKQVISNPRRGLWLPKVLNFWETVLGIEIPESKKEKALRKFTPF